MSRPAIPLPIDAKAGRKPTEKEEQELRNLYAAYRHLEALGWKDAIYCPKDGTMFNAIVAGSTGIFDCNYQGEWPTGSWWLYDGDVWPARPILWMPRKPDEGK